MSGDEREELNRLLAENRRLRELLAEHGIAWQPRDPATTTERLARLRTDEKVKQFAGLFRGREDVYPIRWEQGRQVGLLTSMRERVAGRRLRETASQVRRLRAPRADPGHGPDGLRPPRRPAHGRGVSAPDR